MRNLCSSVGGVVAGAACLLATVAPAWAASSLDGELGHIRYFLLGSFIFLLVMLLVVVAKLILMTRGESDRLIPITAHVLEENYIPKVREMRGPGVLYDSRQTGTDDGPVDPTKMGMTKILPKHRSAPNEVPTEGGRQKALEDPATVIFVPPVPSGPIHKQKDEDPWEALLNKVKQDEAPARSQALDDTVTTPPLKGKVGLDDGLAPPSSPPRVVKEARKASLPTPDPPPIEDMMSPPSPQRKVLPAPKRPDVIPPPERASQTQKMDNLNFKIDMGQETNDLT